MIFFFVFISVSNLSFSQARQEKAVAEAVEKYRKAAVEGDKSALENIMLDKLSYGHSTGLVENKNTFVDNMTNGKYDFVTMDLSDQTIAISDKTAIVRYKLDGTTNDGGKPGEAHLFVLMIFQKKGGEWKVLARQAVKQPVKS